MWLVGATKIFQDISGTPRTIHVTRLDRDDQTGAAQAIIVGYLLHHLFKFDKLGTHLRRDTIMPQWFQASKAAAASDGHAVHC
jgi:hypothetical protein